MGELAAAAAEEEKCFGSFYICFFLEEGEGAFLVLLLLGSTWLSLSFFPGRASLEDGRGKMEERKRGEKGSKV